MAPHPHLGYQNPVIGHDFADPGVYFDEHSETYYAFSTNANGKNIQCSYSKDFCSWTHHDQDLLPGPLPAWTSMVPGFLWAPEVIAAPQGRGGHLMYVSCQEGRSKKQCIAVAYTRGGPLGPYGFISNGPIISRAETGGSLDPQPFQDPVSGARFLVFKADADHMFTKGPQLWISRLSEDGLSLDGDLVPLQAPSQPYQGDVLEAPYLTYHAESNSYCLFYSSGNFSTKGYATSYAISRSGLFGPYHPCPVPILSTDTPRSIFGPGGACIIKGIEGNHFIVFHALEREQGPRRMCVHRIEFSHDGVPILPGRPNTGKRLRLGAEFEDDLEIFGTVERDDHHHQQQQQPFYAPAPAHSSSSSNHQHHSGQNELIALAGGILGGAVFGYQKEKNHKTEKKHKKKKSHSGSDSSSSSSSSSSDSD